MLKIPDARGITAGVCRSSAPHPHAEDGEILWQSSLAMDFTCHHMRVWCECPTCPARKGLLLLLILLTQLSAAPASGAEAVGESPVQGQDRLERKGKG